MDKDFRAEMQRLLARRRWLKAGIAGLGMGAAELAGVPLLFGNMARAASAEKERILVVFELSGGNDGLNTVIPYTDDAYYKLRPKLALKGPKLRKIDDRYAFSPGMAGFERLYKDGRMAIVHGCGYENPSFSHFASMAYWHTAAPNSGDEYGWVGRLADSMRPDGQPNYMINIDETQSLAVKARKHVPVVFDAPDRFARKGFFQQKPLFDHVSDAEEGDDANHRYLLDVARSARDASALVREAWARYRTPVDYGIVPADLPKIASLIDAGMPTRLYYCAYRHNAFDTHVHQADLHARLITYVSDAVQGFFRDMERIGRADQVSMLMFSEFGRRVPENTSLGTDHGTAGPMFLLGKNVKGGHYGEPVSLTQLDAGDNLIYTTDFRRVYASVIEGWLQQKDAAAVLNGKFEAFPIFA